MDTNFPTNNNYSSGTCNSGTCNQGVTNIANGMSTGGTSGGTNFGSMNFGGLNMGSGLSSLLNKPQTMLPQNTGSYPSTGTGTTIPQNNISFPATGTVLPQNTGSFPAAGGLNLTRQEPETMTNNVYTPAFLRNFIGRLCRVEFLIGNAINDRVGRLLDVGASYIVLQAIEPSTIIVCDIYSIKFVTIVQDTSSESLLLV